MNVDEHKCRLEKKHNLCFDGPINNLQVAPAIGNGDVGALVQQRCDLGTVVGDRSRQHVRRDGVPVKGDLGIEDYIAT